ncbi:hypothetical protein [Nocardia sp. NPDC004750]
MVIESSWWQKRVGLAGIDKVHPPTRSLSYRIGAGPHSLPIKSGRCAHPDEQFMTSPPFTWNGCVISPLAGAPFDGVQSIAVTLPSHTGEWDEQL